MLGLTPEKLEALFSPIIKRNEAIRKAAVRYKVDIKNTLNKVEIVHNPVVEMLFIKIDGYGFTRELDLDNDEGEALYGALKKIYEQPGIAGIKNEGA